MRENRTLEIPACLEGSRDRVLGVLAHVRLRLEFHDHHRPRLTAAISTPWTLSGASTVGTSAVRGWMSGMRKGG